MKLIEGNICAPKGFLATGVHAGIRKHPGKPDLGIIYSTHPAVAAGVFTTNLAKAAPVILSQQHLGHPQLQAIVVNSANANACTGAIGMQHAEQMAKTTAEHLDIPMDYVAVASTGIMGVTLPIDKITKAIKQAVVRLGTGGDLTAEAIMTTDTFAKKIAIEININGNIVCIGGIAKGSGMIHPNMATMLGFITTDAAIEPAALQAALTKANQASFNMITVDGDCSTNDMVLILANGLAKNKLITIDTQEWELFYHGLLYVCTYLAKQIAKDGEGATKMIEVQVNGAATQIDAEMAARAVCRSPLVKTAIFGINPNWGRIAAALGASGAHFDLQSLSIQVGNLPLMQYGSPVAFDENVAVDLLKENTIIIQADLGKGQASAIAWGCDLAYDYIKINAAYKT